MSAGIRGHVAGISVQDDRNMDATHDVRRVHLDYRFSIAQITQFPTLLIAELNPTKFRCDVQNIVSQSFLIWFVQ